MSHHFKCPIYLVLFCLTFMDCDSAVASNDPTFWDKIRPYQYIVGYVPGDSSFTNYKGSTFLMHSDSHGWVLLAEGSGSVWIRMSGGEWNRIDDTYFRGYDFGCYPFMQSGYNFYKYGGYGFWKSNGILTVFDFKKKEWEPLLLNREVKSVHRFCFFDEPNKKLYQLGSLDFNEGMRNPSKYTDSLFVLQVESHTWTTKGRISSEFDEYNPARFYRNNGVVLPTKSGFLFISADLKSVEVDFLSDSFYLFTISANERLKELYMHRLNGKDILLTDKDGIKSFSTDNLTETGFISWSDVLKERLPARFLLEDTSILTSNWLLYSSLGFVVALIFFVYYRRRKRVSSDVKAFGDILVVNDSFTDCTLNAKSFQSLLSTEELAILLKIIDGQIKDNPVTPLQLNEILHIDSLSMESQKNYRSEVIKSINQKTANHFGHQFDFIVRNRSEIDRRMMAYTITDQISIQQSQIN